MKDMVRAILACHLGCFIRTAIFNDQNFNRIKAFNRPWQLLEGFWEVFRFIKAGDLNDEFHSYRNLLNVCFSITRVMCVFCDVVKIKIFTNAY
jgi:hypothetical protein